MANRYWVGGTNTWNGTAGTKWATTSGGAGGASVPGSADDVFFDAASGAVTVTWASASAIVRSINCTDFTGTLATGGFSKTLNSTGTVWTSPSTCTITGAPTLTVSSPGSTAISVTCNHASPSATNAPNFSFTGGTYALTLSGTGFRALTFTGSSCTASGSISMYQNLTLSSGGTFTSLAPTFLATASVTSVGKTLGNTTVNTAAGTVTLVDAMTADTTSTTTLTAGTLDLANFTLSTGIFSSSNSNTRAISFGSGNIALTSTTAATTVLSMATATGFTFTGTGGFTRNMAATATVVFGTTGGTTSNAPNLTVNAGASALTITSGSYFRTVDFTGSTCTVTAALPTGLNMAGNLTLASGGTYTGVISTFRASGTLTSNGTTLGGVTVNGAGITVTLADAAAMNVAGSSFTLTLGTINLAGFTLSANRLESSNSNVRSINFGSGGSIILTSGAGGDIVLMTNATNFTWTGTGGINLTGILSTVNYAFGATGGTSTNVLDVTVSISSAGQVTFTTGTSVRSINCISGLCFLVSQGGTTLYGNLTLASGGTYTGFAPTFLASATVTSNGKTLGNTTINGSGITVTLADAMTLGAFSTFTLTQGTLDLAGFTLSAGIFSSSNSNTRAITFGSGNIALTSTLAATTVLSMADATNFTWTGTGNFTRSMSVATATVVFGTTGGSITNAPNLTINAGSNSLTITSGSWFKNVAFTGSTCAVTASNLNVAGDLTLASGGTYTAVVPTFIASGTVTSAGRTLGNTTINGSGITVTLADAMTVGTTNTFTLTQGTLALANFNLSAGAFSSSNSNTRAITFGSGNIALTSTTAATTVLSMTNATNFTWTGTGEFTRNQAATATFVFGTSGGTTSNAPNLTVNAGALALTFTSSSWFRDINFTGSTCTPTGSINNVGNLTLASGGIYTTLALNFRASATITSTSRTVNGVQVNGSGITVTLADAMTILSNGTLTLTQGTFTAANFNVTAGLFSSSNSNTRTLNMGSGTWTISGSGATAWNTATTTGLTVVPSTSTITMTNASAKTFAGGGLTYYNLNQGGAGALTISGSNTFNNITNSTQPATVTFTAGTTQTVSAFGLSGTAGNLITINSTTPGSQFTLSDASGTINAQYLAIQDSNATGGAVWNALFSTNLGNNTGWIFPGGNMFLMFI